MEICSACLKQGSALCLCGCGLWDDLLPSLSPLTIPKHQKQARVPFIGIPKRSPAELSGDQLIVEHRTVATAEVGSTVLILVFRIGIRVR